MSRRPPPTGLDWDAVTARYVANGGELRPEVWGIARKAQAEALRAANDPEPQPRKAGKEPTGRPSHNPLGRGAVVEVSRAQIQDMVARYTGGEPSPSIARSYDVASNTVLKLLREQGVTIRDLKKVIAPDRVQELIAQYNAGATFHQLAAAEGVGPAVMARALKGAGLEVRSKSAARTLGAQR